MWGLGGRGAWWDRGRGRGGRGKGRERQPGADSAPGCEWGVGEGGDEETRVCPSLLRVKRVQAVTGESDHTSLRVARLLVDGGEADHGHPGLQLILALVPLPLVLLAATRLAAILATLVSFAMALIVSFASFGSTFLLFIFLLFLVLFTGIIALIGSVARPRALIISCWLRFLTPLEHVIVRGRFVHCLRSPCRSALSLHNSCKEIQSSLHAPHLMIH